MPNVVGVGIGEKLKQGIPTGGICLRIYVTKKVSKGDLGVDKLVQGSLDDIPTDVVEIDQPIPYQFTGRNRPAVGGDSIGHFMVTAGTLGCLMQDGAPIAGSTMSSSSGLGGVSSSSRTFPAHNFGGHKVPFVQGAEP